MERLHGDLREEGQRALRAHHAVGDDVEGIVVVYQRTDVESGDVLYTIFIMYALHQLLVGSHAVAQVADLLQEVDMRLGKGFLAGLVACVEQRSVGKDDAHGAQHHVAVGMHATVHSRCIVAHDATNHGTVDRCWVGREHAVVGLEQTVYMTAHHTGSQGHRVVVVAEGEFLPILSGHDEHGIAQALSGERGAGRTEGEGQMVVDAGANNLLYFLLTV